MPAIALVLGCMLTTAAAGDGFTRAALERAHEQVAPAVGLLRYSSEVTNPNTGDISRRDGTALGLVVSPDGLVMAHGHMALENTRPFNIRLTLSHDAARKEYALKLLRKPDDINVVFLRVQSDEALNLPHVRFAQDHGLGIGAPVTLFGLLGESLDHNPAIEVRRIASVLEEPRTTFCLDGAVRFGSVGGPVVDPAGRAVGVVGFDLSRAEGGDLYVRSGHPLVFHAALFQRYIDNPPTEDDAPDTGDDAWFGVFTQPLTDAHAEYWGLEATGGLIVSTVVPGSPAADAGFQPGDVVVQFNDTPIRARHDRDVLGFTQLVRRAGPGAEARIQYLRDGELREQMVVLGERPRSARDAGEYEDPHFGLTVRELTTDVRIALNLPEDVRGVIVRRVRSGSPAHLARMRPGVIILNFGDHPVTDLESFETAIENVLAARPAEIAVLARVGQTTGFFRIDPRWGDHAAP